MLPVAAADALSRMETADAADIIYRMPNETAVLTIRAISRENHPALFRAMPRPAAIRLRMQMRYPEALIGSLVDSDALTLQPNQRASDALRLMRAGNRRITQQIYIINAERRLTGYLELTSLIANRERTPLSRIQQSIPLVLNTRAPLHTVEDLEIWLNFDSLPVVDRHGNFQGVLHREAINREDRSLLSGISSEREFRKSRTALADIFWLLTSSLLAPRDALSYQKKKDE
jgi:Mg/Co/Ni transporter MgtE